VANPPSNEADVEELREYVAKLEAQEGEV